MVYEYATKSEIIHRDNLAPLAKPVPDGLWPIGIDYGFSGVKGFAPNKVFCYPNCAVKLTENEFNSMLDSSDTDIFIRDNEGTWVVGERASKVITAENSMNYEAEMYGRNRYFSPVFKALMKVGLGIEVASNGIRSYNGEKLLVQTGLPPKYRAQDTDLMRDTLTGNYDFEMKLGSGPFQRYVFSVTPNNVFVMDQPMGSMISAITSNQGVQSKEDLLVLASNSIVFDPGFMTLDTYDVVAGKVNSSNTFDTLGMHEIFKRTVEEVRARYGSNITIPEMQNALRRGYITSFDRRTMSSKNIPFDDIIHKHTDAVCDEAIQKMLSIYNYLQNHNYLIVTGGTGNAWWNRITDYLKNMESLKILSGNRCDPSLSNTYSNVRGYFQYIVALASRRG